VQTSRVGERAWRTVLAEREAQDVAEQAFGAETAARLTRKILEGTSQALRTQCRAISRSGATSRAQQTHLQARSANVLAFLARIAARFARLSLHGARSAVEALLRAGRIAKLARGAARAHRQSCASAELTLATGIARQLAGQRLELAEVAIPAVQLAGGVDVFARHALSASRGMLQGAGSACFAKQTRRLAGHVLERASATIRTN